MRHADNDNEPDTFQTLAAATARVISAKEEPEPQREKRETDGANDESAKPHPDKDSEYVVQRLRDWAAFERRYDGNKRRKV